MRKQRKNPPPLDYFNKMRITQSAERKILDEQEQIHLFVDDSEGMKRVSEVHLKAKAELLLETEAFITNISFNKTAIELVAYIHTIVENSAVRCQLIKNKKTFHGHNGCAVVIFKTMQQFQSFASHPRLTFDNRDLRVKQGDGSSKGRRGNLKPFEAISFKGERIELGLSVSDLSAPFNVEWETGGIPLEMEINTEKRSIVLKFDQEGSNQVIESYTVEMSMRRLRRVVIGQNGCNIIVILHCQYPPKIFCKEKPRNILQELNSLFNFSLADIMPGIQNNLLWELSGADKEDVWLRTVDFTDHNAFGRCLMYRVVLGNEKDVDLHRLFKVFKDFGLLRSSDRGTVNSFGSASNSKNKITSKMWALVNGSRGLPFSTLYWLHCLEGANKLDLQSRLDTADKNSDESIYKIIEKLQSTGKLKSEYVLQLLYLNPKVVFISNFIELFEASLEDPYVNTCIEDLQNREHDYEDPLNEMIEVRRVLITPLRVCPQPPSPEQSNRVVRMFSEHIDRFLRVVFVDDNFGSILQVFFIFFIHAASFLILLISFRIYFHNLFYNFSCL